MKAKRVASHIVTLLALTLLVPNVEAQTGRVALTATVSETVALSVLPVATDGNVHTEVVSSGKNTVRITLSGVNSEAVVVRVPFLVRSNSSFRISAALATRTAVLTELSVLDVRATGTLVSPQATNGLNVPPQLDLRGPNKNGPSARNLLDDVRPVLVASGPRVSTGGTLNSPNNALQLTVLMDLKPQMSHDWSVQLTFVAESGQSIQ
jgi:hypothetical protein